MLSGCQSFGCQCCALRNWLNLGLDRIMLSKAHSEIPRPFQSPSATQHGDGRHHRCRATNSTRSTHYKRLAASDRPSPSLRPPSSAFCPLTSNQPLVFLNDRARRCAPTSSAFLATISRPHHIKHFNERRTSRRRTDSVKFSLLR